MKADHVESAHKASNALAKDRIQNRKADKAAVAEHQGELKNFDLVWVLFEKPANAECHQRKKRVHHKADQGDLPCDRYVFGGVLGVCQRRNDHSRLTNGNDQLRKPLGGGILNDLQLAAEKSAHQQDEKGEYNGKLRLVTSSNYKVDFKLHGICQTTESQFIN